MPDNTKRDERRRGFTLVELLIVISIMVVLAAIVIPKLRVVTADRKIREAARLVDSTFASARDDAVVNGFAGIEIVRNANYGNGATSMYRMRARPPYTGDFQGDGVTIDPGNILRYWHETVNPTPPPAFTYTEYFPNPPLETNDFIQFNNRGPLYRMLSATSFEVLSYQAPPPSMPSPPSTSVLPFKIFRKPVRVISSEIRMPAGQLIDFRFSGDHDTSGAAASLNGQLNPVPLPAPNTNSFIVIFDQHGAIERYYPQGFVGTALLPAGPLFLLIAIDEESDGLDPLQNMANLWVTVNQTNGAVKVSETASTSVQAPPFAPATTARLDAARALALERRTANQ